MLMSSLNSFGASATLRVADRSYQYFRLNALGDVSRLPFSIKILLENLLRHEDGQTVKASDIEYVARWNGHPEDREISFMPARVLLQDFTGVPVVVDLAAMRDALHAMGKDPTRANPLLPADLVIDHSVQVDHYGTPDAFSLNSLIEFQRNRERYTFLRWGQAAFRNFRVVPPETGIIHQVNLEYFAPVVFTSVQNGTLTAYPDTLVGTDSHTTMINGLGVVGWGVGGIEAEACMLGQPISMLLPPVVGFRLYGRLREGVTATDLVLTVTQMLRKKGVVGKFVEYYGEGLDALSLADRATIANMSPEYGATIGLFPIDDETLRYLRLTHRPPEVIALVEAYAKEQGLFRTPGAPEPLFSDTLELDLATVEPSLAGPKRPQDRLALSAVKQNFLSTLGTEPRRVSVSFNGAQAEIQEGSVVIAAITSCTNTSNPAVLLAAGLLAKKAVERGLKTPPWVKTSLAPGSKVVMDYLREAGVLPHLEQLGFHLVGFGCTTCIGNSGPLPEPVAQAVQKERLVVASVLSGNRNFEGRVNALVKANYLASPPLVVAYALAGRVDIDLQSEPLASDPSGCPVYLKDLWPSDEEVRQAAARFVRDEMFEKQYSSVFEGDEQWKAISVTGSALYPWDPASTYIKKPPYFDSLGDPNRPVSELGGLRVLAMLGDSVTTDHISPAGSIAVDSPAGQYLISLGVEPKDFNSYGARRGNHEVMMRGTLANIRLRNQLAPGTEGGWTIHVPSGEKMWIYDAAMRYQKEGTGLLILAGKEYGSGSSRDWAAKGVALLGVKAVIAESFERIHRSNLVGMGVLPLEFSAGQNRESLGLTGHETYFIEGIREALEGSRRARVRAVSADGVEKSFEVTVRVDTPREADYYRHGGILPYVLRQLAG
ncbi:MAG: aconitate hydratase AcnA [Bryobacteraceae bacterium]|nr:aconitate hydratase AcnA [Bryobacteraceae bacterium]